MKSRPLGDGQHVLYWEKRQYEEVIGRENVPGKPKQPLSGNVLLLLKLIDAEVLERS